jgi:hypothetical protein
MSSKTNIPQREEEEKKRAKYRARSGRVMRGGKFQRDVQLKEQTVLEEAIEHVLRDSAIRPRDRILLRMRTEEDRKTCRYCRARSGYCPPKINFPPMCQMVAVPAWRSNALTIL